MNTKRIALKKVKLATYNPRITLTPEDQEWKDIEASLGEFGYLGGMVVNTRTMNLVAGHQRLAILRARGETAVEFATVDLDDASERRLNVVMNRVSGRWDDSKLADLLSQLQAQQLDISTLGFSPAQIQDLLTKAKPAPKQDPDAPAPPVTIAVTKPGDIYELWTGDGSTRHRVMCGDSCDPEQMQRLMDGQKARLIFTDPPYNVAYTGSHAREAKWDGLNNDEMAEAQWIEWLGKVLALAHQHSIPKAALYVCYANANANANAIAAGGWRLKQTLIWMKHHFTLQRHDYHWMHEPIHYGSKAGENCEWLGARDETTLFQNDSPDLDKLTKDEMRAMLQSIRDHSDIWEEKRDASARYLHPCQKPTSLSRRALRNSSLPGEIVIDSFGGSGSTMIGAELEGRQARLMELDGAYVDAAVARFGKTFEHAHTSLNGKQYE